jgi:HK97 gp10 family phage protein
MSAKLIGDKELEKLFRTLGERVQRKVLRSAVSAGAAPVVKAAKAKARRQSGLLKKAMAKKIVTNKRTNSVSAIIGAKKQVTGTYKGKVRKPSRYLHLQEKPHLAADGSYVPAQPMLGPAAAESQDAALGTIQSKLKEGVEREALKGAGQ